MDVRKTVWTIIMHQWVNWCVCVRAWANSKVQNWTGGKNTLAINMFAWLFCLFFRDCQSLKCSPSLYHPLKDNPRLHPSTCFFQISTQKRDGPHIFRHRSNMSRTCWSAPELYSVLM